VTAKAVVEYVEEKIEAIPTPSGYPLSEILVEVNEDISDRSGNVQLGIHDALVIAGHPDLNLQGNRLNLRPESNIEATSKRINMTSEEALAFRLTAPARNI
jgi:hypothetical protein